MIIDKKRRDDHVDKKVTFFCLWLLCCIPKRRIKLYFENRELVITLWQHMYPLQDCCVVVVMLRWQKMSKNLRNIRKINFNNQHIDDICCSQSHRVVDHQCVWTDNNSRDLCVLVHVNTDYSCSVSHFPICALCRAIGSIVFGPVMFVAMFLPFLSAFQQRVMSNNAITFGMEVSKLFAHDIAPTQLVKVKQSKKKKRWMDVFDVTTIVLFILFEVSDR